MGELCVRGEGSKPLYCHFLGIFVHSTKPQCTLLNLGKHAFSVAAPIIWNELPTTLKSCESLASFRKNLKTYLFKIAFPP